MNKTVQQAVDLVNRTGCVTINPLAYRKNPYKDACFEASKLGLVRKVRENCGRFNFYPLGNPMMIPLIPEKPASTLEGIKRTAKRIKKDEGISHSEALNKSAIKSGYQNFRHAQNTLEKANES